jgi:hypothetical protein
VSVQSDRVAAGFAAAGVFIALALAPGALSIREIVFLLLAALVLLLTFAPVVPVLHLLPRVGAPRVRVALSFEPNQDGDEALEVRHVEGLGVESRVLRVGFINDGPKRVRGALINVLVPAEVELTACDYDCSANITHGKAMPQTIVDDRPMRFWADKDVDFHVGAILLHYRLSFPHVLRLGDQFPVRVTYSSDDLYGGERICEQQVQVSDLKDAFVGQ